MALFIAQEERNIKKCAQVVLSGVQRKISVIGQKMFNAAADQ